VTNRHKGGKEERKGFPSHSGTVSQWLMMCPINTCSMSAIRTLVPLSENNFVMPVPPKWTRRRTQHRDLMCLDRFLMEQNGRHLQCSAQVTGLQMHLI